jgi:hypothetical protein
VFRLAFHPTEANANFKDVMVRIRGDEVGKLHKQISFFLTRRTGTLKDVDCVSPLGGAARRYTTGAP